MRHRWRLVLAAVFSLLMLTTACSSDDVAATEERDTAAGTELLERMNGEWQVVEAVRGFEGHPHVTKATMQFDTYVNGGVEDQVLGVSNGCNGSDSGRIVWGAEGYRPERQRPEAEVDYVNQGSSCDESLDDVAFVLSSIPIGSLVTVELFEEDTRATLFHDEWEIVIERLPGDGA